jgi:hypothetical protein
MALAFVIPISTAVNAQNPSYVTGGACRDG